MHSFSSMLIAHHIFDTFMDGWMDPSTLKTVHVPKGLKFQYNILKFKVVF